MLIEKQLAEIPDGYPGNPEFSRSIFNVQPHKVPSSVLQMSGDMPVAPLILPPDLPVPEFLQERQKFLPGIAQEANEIIDVIVGQGL